MRALNRSSSTTRSMVCEVVDGKIRVGVADDALHRRSELQGIALGVHVKAHAVEDCALRIRDVDVRICGDGLDVILIDVAHDADDGDVGFHFVAGAEAELHSDRIAAGEEALGDGFADNADFRRGGVVGFGEFAAGNERNAESGEIGRDRWR